MTSRELSGHGPRAVLSFPEPDVFAINDERYGLGHEAICDRGRLRLTHGFWNTSYFGPEWHYRSVWLVRTRGSLVVKLEEVDWFFIAFVVPSRMRIVEWYRYPAASM